MSSLNIKSISLCIFLFLASALVSVTIRSSPHPRGSWPPSLSQIALHQDSSLPPTPQVAFATFLAAIPNPDRKPTDPHPPDEEDGYYLSTRVLIYQLLHSRTAASNTTTTTTTGTGTGAIPILVLCTRDVSARKRARLKKDGARIILVDKISAPWATTGVARWVDNLAKLHLFQLTEYAKICFIDADHLVTKPLDGVFSDEATLLSATLPNAQQTHPDEAPLPRTYLLASHGDYGTYAHPYPPPPDLTSLNAGFFVCAPSRQLYDYYISLLSTPHKFDPSFMEQNLLNYAHRREGNMPWKPLWYGWNVNWPTANDWRGGAASFHAKFWDGDPSHDPVLKAIWREQRAEMEGFWRGREGGF